MKVSDLKVQPSNGGGGREPKATRAARIRAWMKDKANTLVKVDGKLLATVVNGKTLAAHVIAGEILEFDTVTLNPAGDVGRVAKGFTISLANVGQWACPACRSAHGTGVGPSPAISLKGLESNQFYYRPSDGHLLTISTDCYKSYLVDKDDDNGNKGLHRMILHALPKGVKAVK